MEKIKVVIADDHVLFRHVLKMLLKNSHEIQVVAEACNGIELVKLVKKHLPDVVLTDVIMPGMNGIEAIKEIHLSGITRIIAISTYDTDQLMVDALEAGAMGFLLKNVQPDEVVEAIKTVYKFEQYYCKSTLATIMKLTSKNRFRAGNKNKEGLFTEKEKEIICLICQEKTSEEIGEILFMSKRTVEGFRSRIQTKMGVKSPQGMVVYAIKHGIFPNPTDNLGPPDDFESL